MEDSGVYVAGVVTGIILTIFILFIWFALIVGSRADDTEYTEDSENIENE